MLRLSLCLHACLSARLSACLLECLSLCLFACLSVFMSVCHLYLCVCAECRFTRAGSEYAGRISQTRTGRQCQRWGSQVPHPHNFTGLHLYPDDRLEDAANYCRNPSPRRHPDGPWCLTADQRLPPWEQCDISFCGYSSATSLWINWRNIHRPIYSRNH